MMFYIMHVQQKKKPAEKHKPMRLEFAVTNQETVLEFARMFEHNQLVEAYWVNVSNGPVIPFYFGLVGNQWPKWQTK